MCRFVAYLGRPIIVDELLLMALAKDAFEVGRYRYDMTLLKQAGLTG